MTKHVFGLMLALGLRTGRRCLSIGRSALRLGGAEGQHWVPAASTRELTGEGPPWLRALPEGLPYRITARMKDGKQRDLRTGQ